MIRIEEVRTFGANAEDLFHFLADFRNLPLWDPGIANARLIQGDVRSSRARYAVESRFFGLRVLLNYKTSRYDETSFEAVIEGEGDSVRAVDRIFITSRNHGCQLRWQADFELKGLRRFSEPLSRPVFVRLGDKAMRGLTRYAAKNPAFASPFR